MSYNDPDTIYRITPFETGLIPGLPTATVCTFYGVTPTQHKDEPPDDEGSYLHITPECLGCGALLPLPELGDLGWISRCEYCGRWHTI